MGIAAGFGQTNTSQQTGVGASPSTNGQSQSAGSQYGGKGGGLGANPYAPQQNATTAQQQTYMPMGGSAFGYNMQRLAGRMDPSATLPGEYQPSQQQPQYQQPQFDFGSAFGGKGGGRGMGGYDYYGGYGPQPPQFFQPQYQQNPFTEQPQKDQYGDRFSALEEKLNNLLSAQKGTPTSAPDAPAAFAPASPAPSAPAAFAPASPAPSAPSAPDAPDAPDAPASPAPSAPAGSSEIVDTGEATYSQPKAAENFGVGTKAAPASTPLTNEELVAADKEKAAEAEKIDPVTGQPKYQYSAYKAATEEQLTGLGSAANIKSFYAQQTAAANKDLAQAQKDLKAAQTSGSIDDQIAAQRQLSSVQQRQAQIAADQKKSLSQIGKTGYQTTAQIQTAKDTAAQTAFDTAIKNAKLSTYKTPTEPSATSKQISTALATQQAEAKNAQAAVDAMKKAGASPDKIAAAQKIADAQKAEADQAAKDLTAKQQAETTAATAAANKIKYDNQTKVVNTAQTNVNTAKSKLDAAKAALDKAATPKDKTAAQTAFDNAKKAYDQANKVLTDAQNLLKTYAPTTGMKKGGIVHKGMTARLKKMLGEK